MAIGLWIFLLSNYQNIEYRIGEFKKLPISDYRISDQGLNLSEYRISDLEKLSVAHLYILPYWPCTHAAWNAQESNPGWGSRGCCCTSDYLNPATPLSRPWINNYCWRIAYSGGGARLRSLVSNCVQLSLDIEYIHRWEETVFRIRIRDPVSFWPLDLDPGSGIGFFRIPDHKPHLFESLVTNFWVKSSIFLWKLA